MRFYKIISAVVVCLVVLSGCQTTQQSDMAEAKPITPVPSTLVEAIVDQPSPEEIYLWHRIRAGFSLPEVDQKSVNHERKRYLRHKDVLAEINRRSADYLYLIVEALDQQGMPLELALLPFVESGFDPYAYSHGGAVGLWQFMPATGKRFGLQQDWWFEGRRDIVQSTQAAVEYLTYLNDMFDGDWMLAIAAYNSGEGRVQRAVRANKKAGKPADFFSLKLPAETRAYVPRLLAISDIVRNAERYGLELPSLTNAPRVIPTNVGGQIELAVISELSGVPSARIAELNPGFNRWATSPTGEHAVLIPLENQQQLTEGLAQLPTKQRVSWQRYQVKSGDSLGKIAQQHHTTVKVLMTSNDLNNHLIRKGQHLMIPLGDNARLPPVRAGEAKPIKYQVKSGDSLWLIAKKHGVKYQDISRWNALSSTTLRPGQSLDIYTKTPQKEVRTVKYRVRSGDSLSVIAKRFDVTINALKQWNGLNSDRLRAGQNLTIKVDINRG